MASQGAAILDVGGESTRPGGGPSLGAAEVERVLPVIQQLAAGGAAVSVDGQGEVMAAAVRRWRPHGE